MSQHIREWHHLHTLIQDTLTWNLHQEDLSRISTLPLERKHSQTRDTGSNCTRPSRKPTVLIPLVERIRMGKPREISQEWKQEPTYKGMTPPSIQNLKALGLRILFLICCSTFSFLPSMKLRLTLVPNNKWAFLFYFLWENIYLIFVFIFC